jgi:hypothetical protein
MVEILPGHWQFGVQQQMLACGLGPLGEIPLLPLTAGCLLLSWGQQAQLTCLGAKSWSRVPRHFLHRSIRLPEYGVSFCGGGPW